MDIRIGQLPGNIVPLTLDDGSTVATALTEAGLDASGFEIRVGDTPGDTETVLNNGDLVLLLKKIKGN